MRSNRKGLLILGIVTALLAACGPSTEGSSPSSTPVASGSSATASAADPGSSHRLEDAWVGGSYSVRLRTTSSVPDQGGATSEVWGIDAKCKEGACEASLGLGPKIQLKRSGRTYKGQGSGAFGSTCDGDAVDSRLNILIRIVKGATKDGVWTGTRVDVRMSQVVGPSGSCASARLTSVGNGDVTSKPAGTFEVPSATLVTPLPGSPQAAIDALVAAFQAGSIADARAVAETDAVAYFFSASTEEVPSGRWVKTGQYSWCRGTMCRYEYRPPNGGRWWIEFFTQKEAGGYRVIRVTPVDT